MCFSATASFTVSGLLGLTSIVSIRMARPALKLFASTPLFFALQQLSEGVIWLTANSFAHQSMHTIATYCFLFFALIFWPLWISSIILGLEYNPTRKKIAYLPLLCGIVFSTFSLYILYTYGAISLIRNHHIAYSIPQLSLPYPFLEFLYGSAVILPGLISSIKKAWLLSVNIIIAYFISKVWFPEHFPSVWCFFAAIISSTVLIIVWSQRKNN